jgi:8-oxo-dGTP diphosphatase
MQKQIEFIARGFIFQNGKVLLCKRKDRDYYFFPGGHIEFGEFAEDALKRELMEEIDAKITKCEFIGMAENVFRDGERETHEINFTFQAEIDREDTRALEDYLEFCWLSYDEFLKEKVLPTSLKDEIIKWEKDKKIFWTGQNDLK